MLPARPALLLAVLAMVAVGCSADVTGRPCTHDVVMETNGAASAQAATYSTTVHAQGVGATVKQPIRIGVFTKDLEDDKHYCAKDSATVSDMLGGTIKCANTAVLDSTHKDTLLTKLLPEAIKLHTDRLWVTPLAKVGPVTMAGKVCKLFTVPSAHTSSGVSGYDLLIYVAAAPIKDDITAWAVSCVDGTDGRPVAGVLDVTPVYIEDTPEQVRTVAHQLGHLLGFYVPRFTKMGLVTKQAVIGKPASNVHQGLAVKQAVQSFYKCSTATWMELEDQAYGLSKKMSPSHWKRRIAKDELMSTVYVHGYYTAFTMAAFQDMGYYWVNYSLAEHMDMGYQAGCNILTKMCVEKGQSNYPFLFCTQTGTNVPNEGGCTTDYTGIGMCGLVKVSTAPASYYEHFLPDEKQDGNPDDQMDYCPYYHEDPDYSCLTSSKIPGGGTGSASRCLPGPFNGITIAGGTTTTSAICAPVRCDAAAETYEFQLDTKWLACPAAKKVDVGGTTFTSGTVTCPPYSAVCLQGTVGRDVTVLESPLSSATKSSHATHTHHQGTSSEGTSRGWAGALTALAAALLALLV